ncbi:tRNA pseudouridine(13) synthase TruD [Candidatus Woesearchaeota archaeon]|nr:tRNA pseudouridine(13) synthase TruD [Candidatus Woesearchaeota archaeon]
MYRIKQIPEDFVVKEKSIITPETQGRYCYVLLRKTQRNTLDVIKEISRQLHLKEKQIGFAGTKDKHGITEQVISLFAVSPTRITALHLENVVLTILGFGHKPISLGDLESNYFKIVVRNLEPESAADTLPLSPYLENYFDEQRFSTDNVSVGKALLKKNFAEAIELMRNDVCLSHLQEHPRDYVGALKKIPLRLLRMYINAFQSSLWNQTAAEYLRRKGKVCKKVSSSQGELVFVNEMTTIKDIQLPLVGFGDLLTDEPLIREIVDNLLREENISQTDFIIRQIPELTVEGELRSLFVPVTEIALDQLNDDELNGGKKKIRIQFTLPRGSYATMVIKKWLE